MEAFDKEGYIGEILGLEPFQFADDQVGGGRSFDGKAQAAEDRVIGSVWARMREDQRLLVYNLEVVLLSDVFVRWIEAKAGRVACPAKVRLNKARAWKDVDVDRYALLQAKSECRRPPPDEQLRWMLESCIEPLEILPPFGRVHLVSHSESNFSDRGECRQVEGGWR